MDEIRIAAEERHKKLMQKWQEHWLGERAEDEQEVGDEETGSAQGPAI